MGIIKGVVLTVSVSAMIAGTASACSFRLPEPQDYGITDIVKKHDDIDSFTGKIGSCDVDGFLRQDKELLIVGVTSDGVAIVPPGLTLDHPDALTSNPAVQHYCGV